MKVDHAEFIRRSHLAHGTRWDYSLVEYKDTKTKVKIVCPVHGEFTQKPTNHWAGKGCLKCGHIKTGEGRKLFFNKNRNWNFEQPKEYKLIPLKGVKFAKVSNEDFDKLKNINWQESYGYAVSAVGSMHRVILNPPENFVIDHRNHDKLDNRRENLRVCSRGDNNRNRRKYTKLSSQYKGVCWVAGKNKWRSAISFNNKNIHIGYFKSEKQAAEAYNLRALSLFKEFAKLNKIEGCGVL